MDRFKARFERNRGQYLVVEGDPPLSRAECDEMQLRMLQTSVIEGFMRPDPEEIDGNLVFRYSLQGARMLSQAMRSGKWSMEDWMTALCRLTELLEESRLYFLDAERIRLDDDWIFVGQGWQDLKLVYLPVKEAAESAQDRLERLIVRWMVQVADLEGPVVQQVMEIVRSPEFTPAKLRRYVRDYLADRAAGAGAANARDPDRMSGDQPHIPWHTWTDNAIAAQHSLRVEEQPIEHAAGSPPAEGWRWFRPAAEEAQPMSGLLGVNSAPYGQDDDFVRDDEKETLGRKRIWLICAAIALIAVVWRAGLAMYPGNTRLLFSGGATLLVLGGAMWMWNRRTETEKDRRDFEEREEGGSSRQADAHHEARLEPIAPISESVDYRFGQEQTGHLGSSWQADMTQQLDNASHSAVKESFYLDWESGRPPVRIPLHDGAVVIGRSSEAANHVDDSHGVSRAHVELVRTPDGWKVKDLGSRNGTRLNEISLVPYESYLLQPEDCLYLAESKYRLKRGS